jgi:hypothetical protein
MLEYKLSPCILHNNGLDFFSVELLCRSTFLSAYTLGSGSRHDVTSCEETNFFFITCGGLAINFYHTVITKIWPTTMNCISVVSGVSCSNVYPVGACGWNTWSSSHNSSVLYLLMYLFVVCLFNKAVCGTVCTPKQSRIFGWLGNNERHCDVICDATSASARRGSEKCQGFS